MLTLERSTQTDAFAEIVASLTDGFDELFGVSRFIDRPIEDPSLPDARLRRALKVLSGSSLRLTVLISRAGAVLRDRHSRSALSLCDEVAALETDLTTVDIFSYEGLGTLDMHQVKSAGTSTIGTLGQFSGFGTPTNKAVTQAAQAMEKQGADNNVILVVTDSKSDFDMSECIAAARSSGVVLFGAYWSGAPGWTAEKREAQAQFEGQGDIVDQPEDALSAMLTHLENL